MCSRKNLGLQFVPGIFLVLTVIRYASSFQFSLPLHSRAPCHSSFPVHPLISSTPPNDCSRRIQRVALESVPPSSSQSEQDIPNDNDNDDSNSNDDKDDACANDEECEIDWSQMPGFTDEPEDAAAPAAAATETSNSLQQHDILAQWEELLLQDDPILLQTPFPNPNHPHHPYMPRKNNDDDDDDTFSPVPKTITIQQARLRLEMQWQLEETQDDCLVETDTPPATTHYNNNNILEQSSTHCGQDPCQDCQGQGWKSCRFCQGTGQLVFQRVQEPQPPRPCNVCTTQQRSTSSLPAGTEPCRSCQGSGWISRWTKLAQQ